MSDSDRVLSLLSDEQYVALADTDAQLASCVYYLTLCETIETEEVTVGGQTVVKSKYMTQEDIAASMGMSYATLLKRRHEWQEIGDLDRARKVFGELKRESILIAQSRVAGQWGTLLERTLERALKMDNLRDLIPVLKFLKEEAIQPLLAERPADEKDESDYMRKVREAKLKSALDSSK